MAQVHNDPPAYTYDGGEQAELAAAVARAEAGGAPPPAYESSGLRQRRPREKAEEDEENPGDPDAGGAVPPASSSSATSAAAPPRAHLHARSASAVTTTTEGMRKYNMWYTTSRLSTTLHRGGPETEAEYYMQSDVMALKKPNLLLRRGPRKDGPVVAFARIRFHTRHVLIGRGDCTAPGWKIGGSSNNHQKHGDSTAGAAPLQVGTDDDDDNNDDDTATKTTTQELHRDRNVFCRSDWRFTTSAGGGELQSTAADGGGGGGAGAAAAAAPTTEFLWRKDMAKLLATVYDCVDGSTGRVVARLRSGGGFNFNKGGEIYLAEDLARPLEELLLVSAEAMASMEYF